jgi:BMFP domain-containing protein YqiC
MSIALDTKVTALEKRVAELEQELMQKTRIESIKHLAQLVARVEELERSCARKPGPKPKEQP